ncbi:MAG: 2-oxoacid:ferredoxin oxidoreductase subunit beta [Ignavibacteria bacterium]|nr:2-oxoacid:ferredoxin oxidoreductase subunit beta [Ignavibacteria bacterium]MBT8383504.1 2-oxoacid:ferredoxin oxidoreductase subunit beta [Ignavibacteria bacterium]MBT8392324.1 2-oxoacid:ferredoxin oxidoreductase subunit beta [Ignavibacteria bacterium]NNJ53764.1 2-oxoacid:ferredoxin oxidoreductase subunit beta [Ignavibacteriaceae bacterium]NNL19815.1 2-oxoacid:ferredoxin oxidoreductase subunit beta [Ignavibacteriaceae bacterium]
MKKTLQDYKSIIEPVWCPGCGDYGILVSIQRALLNLDIDPENIVSVSGIGCSGRLSHFLNTYSLHGTHGRAVPTALGVKAAHPELTVFAVGGDGDGLGIGGGHIAHASRKNVDMNYLLIDNQIYGLTKGQTSPTSPLGVKTKTSPHGVFEDTLDAIPIFLSYDVSFVARANGVDPKSLTQILMEAISHKGMSIVYILSPCRTFPLLDAKGLKAILQPLPEDHPTDNKMVALERAYSDQPIYTGIFYQVQKPTLEDRLQNVITKVCDNTNGGDKYSLDKVLKSFA